MVKAAPLGMSGAPVITLRKDGAVRGLQGGGTKLATQADSIDPVAGSRVAAGVDAPPRSIQQHGADSVLLEAVVHQVGPVLRRQLPAGVVEAANGAELDG